MPRCPPDLTTGNADATMLHDAFIWVSELG